MKNLFKMTLVLASAALVSVSCNPVKKVVKDFEGVKIASTQSVLSLNNGKIATDIVAEIPANCFQKNAVLRLTPALVYAGGITKGESFLLQGEKASENGIVIPSKESISIKRHIEFDYKPEMQSSTLVLIIEGKSGKNDFALINANTGEVLPADHNLTVLEYALILAHGINTLQSDLDFSKAMATVSNNYKRVTTVVTKADIVYRINSSRVGKKAVETEDLKSLKAGVEANKANERVAQSLYVNGYASPDGPEKFNDKLSKKRSLEDV